MATIDTMSYTDEFGQKQLKKQEAYRRMFSTADGKIILKDLGYFCFEEDSTFDKDERITSFNEGRRSVILFIRRMLDTDPKAELQKEAK